MGALVCCRWGEGKQARNLLQAEVFLGGWRRRVPRGPVEPGASEQEGQVVTGDRVSQPCSQGGSSYLTVHDGLLLLQLHFLLSCLGAQQSLEDGPFWKATLLLQGHLTIWGQSTGKAVSVEETVIRVPRLQGGGGGGSKGEPLDTGMALVAGTGSPTLSQQGHEDSTSGPGKCAQILGRHSRTLSSTQ